MNGKTKLSKQKKQQQQQNQIKAIKGKYTSAEHKLNERLKNPRAHDDQQFSDEEQTKVTLTFPADVPVSNSFSALQGNSQSETATPPANTPTKANSKENLEEIQNRSTRINLPEKTSIFYQVTVQRSRHLNRSLFILFNCKSI